ncbi:uncharacterized protein MEPE_06498 [Melanopsichium pennsylvanicum]|uniref:Uncharacterized protein n=2 Tax=Melanopsichium pennsylvanicum TaxID=63383 RepID=A0AAJ4XSU3_9BASI|nr:uncharacterized protein BN887_00801 [Melanopsichium pennsylvanicum 4]SNX87787.1 uncharacterized protein MEPE_06498 [Melanopsichium pennsylvanicum]
MTLFPSLSSKLTMFKADNGSQSQALLRDTDFADMHARAFGDASKKASEGFEPTVSLQVEAIGFDTNQALTSRTLDNISLYEAGFAKYTSLCLKKNSNSCVLVRAYDQATLMATIYRIGPGSHSRMRIFN